MNKRFAISVFLAVCFCSCGEVKKDTPPIAPEKMKLILADMHLAEVYSSMLNDSLHQSRSKNMDSLGIFYTDIFSHHHITKEAFDESMKWYRTHPGDLDSVYNNISAYIGKMENDTAGSKK